MKLSLDRVVVRDGLWAGKSVLCDDKIRRGVKWSRVQAAA